MMKTSRLFMSLVTATLLLTIPATSAWATHRRDAEQAITEAKEAHAKAASVDAASSETAAMIEEAEGLMPSRQFTKAREIALKAKKQDEFAHEQATSGSQDTESMAAAEQALAAAEASRKKAASVGGEWRDTGKMIKEAEGLMRSGEYKAAISLANQAARQGELGYEQAMREKGADFPTYVKKQEG